MQKGASKSPFKRQVLQNASQNKPNEQLQTTTCLEQEAQNAADPSVPPLPLQDALHDQ